MRQFLYNYPNTPYTFNDRIKAPLYNLRTATVVENTLLLIR